MNNLFQAPSLSKDMLLLKFDPFEPTYGFGDLYESISKPLTVVLEFDLFTAL
jgi:hypothetical protein